MISLRPRSLAVLLLVAAASTAAPALPAPPPAEVQTYLDAADDALHANDFKEAIRQFKAADKAAGGSCLECQLGLAKAYRGVGAHKDALKMAETVLRSTTDKQPLAVAYNEQGLALMKLAGDDAEQLKRAEAAFRQVIALGNPAQAHFNLGLVLLRLERDEEGVATLRHYLELDPNGASAVSARELIDNPLRARKRLIPDLELVTLGGDYMTTTDLQGRVLLIDIWGTWCAPCRAAVPDLKRLAKRFEKAPFVMVSISNDSDRPALEKFIAEHEMSWPQVWDESHELLRQLGVNRFPTYLLVDHTGEIVFSASGWGPSIEREIEHRVSSAVKDARKAAPPPAGG